MELGPNDDGKQMQFTLGGSFLGPSTNPTLVLNENVNTHADAQKWTCDICNIIVGRQYRAAHESGMWHVSQAKKQLWTCLMCNITIKASMQADHEAKSAHCKNRDRITSGVQLGEEEEWKCTLCNITVDLASRSSHEYSQVHQMTMIKNQPKASKRKKGKSGRPDKAAKTWICTVCNVTMGTASKFSHESEISHRKSAGKPYPCEVCGVYITIKYQASHEAARIHVAAVISERTTAGSSPTPNVLPTVNPPHVVPPPTQFRSREALPTLASTSYQRTSAAKSSPPAAAPPQTQPTLRTPYQETFQLALSLTAHANFEAEKLNREAMWTCYICSITIDVEGRYEHEYSRGHRKKEKKERKAAKRWTCMMCDVEVPGETREAHENSRQHRVRLRYIEAKAE
ncbi:hypothetical protein DFP73DRAFT_395555 [Morchella snyderi]|nr:hypothetical protein DFP73DRAFT_395555 [Morchella snyderi]